MQSNKIKVLYIAGYSFSGSTILANVLGEIEGFFPLENYGVSRRKI